MTNHLTLHLTHYAGAATATTTVSCKAKDAIA
jgi:hypothetical protein